MTNGLFKLAALSLAGVAAAACSTAPPPAQVTRFHLNQPITRGSIAVRPLGADPATLEQQSQIAAVAAELSRLGFTVSQALSTAALIATVDVQRGMQPPALPARSPVTIGVGGGSFGGGLGIGIGTSFGVGGRKSRDVTVTTLAVQIKRAADETVLWEGRAIGRSDETASSGEEIARLAAALFKDFPGVSGKTVEVK